MKTLRTGGLDTMNALKTIAATSTLILAVSTAGHAQDRATAEEAEAMLAGAIAHYEEVGRDQALADFNDADGGFRDRDLYVFCVGSDDTMVAHPTIVGTDVTTLADADGLEIGNRIIEIGRDDGEGTLDYRWANPTTGEVENKSTFIHAVGDDVCAVGYYVQ